MQSTKIIEGNCSSFHRHTKTLIIIISILIILEHFMKLVHVIKKLKYQEGSHEKTIELIMLKNKNFISLKNELNLMLCILFANLFNIFLCEVLLPL